MNKILFVEDGSVDLEELEKMDLGVDNIVIYRQGSKRPEIVELEEANVKRGEFTEKAIRYAVAKAISVSGEFATEYIPADKRLISIWRISNIDACADKVISILRGADPDVDE